MRLLILTQYYPPEIGAPQNRLHELAVRLQLKGIDVEVLTAMPNYPSMEIHEAYKNGKIREEVIDGVKVFRSKIYVSKSKSIVHRLLNYFSFVITSYFRGRKLSNFDFLMVESPPLFLGYSAILLAKKLNAKLIFNVSDLWPESAEKLDIVNNKSFLKLAYNLEKKCYKRSVLVTGQTNGIVSNIKSRFPAKDVYWLPNGVDLDFYNPDKVEAKGFRVKNGFKKDQILLFYGGILGHAQGLQIIIEAAKTFEGTHKVQFILQGSGPEKEFLINLKNEYQLSNVHFLEPVSKKEMPSVLKEIDMALVPLRKLELFHGAIPSKIFEALAMKVPLLLGVDGEAKSHFIDNAKAGLFFEPENCSDLVANIEKIILDPSLIVSMGENARSYVDIHFNRNNIANEFSIKLHSLS